MDLLSLDPSMDLGRIPRRRGPIINYAPAQKEKGREMGLTSGFASRLALTDDNLMYTCTRPNRDRIAVSRLQRIVRR